MRDRDIRTLLNEYLRGVYQSDPTTLFLDELGVCCGVARVDVAVVNSHLAGYEIKSEADTLERLPRQLETYGKVLDHVTLVANSRHIRRLEDALPHWCGLMEVIAVDGVPEIRELRPAAANGNLDPYSIAQLLWRDEALAVLRYHGLERGFKSKPRSELWRKLVETLSLDDLRVEVRSRLKARGSWRPGACCSIRRVTSSS